MRQVQSSSGPWGHMKTASTLPPAAASSRRILVWMAVSVSMSNSPRARPDWLVAITTFQPACVRRAMACRLPGKATHSSGVLTKASLS
ncbi:hypothetical protein D3C72_2252960 [compost metagenome]